MAKQCKLSREILGTMQSVIVTKRFCGPPDSGNGGYTCGLLAKELDGVVECTLRAPIPMDEELLVKRNDTGAVLLHGEKIIIEATPTVIDVTPPAPISLQAATKAMAKSPALDVRHPFATCFVCGPKRAMHDGLRIFPAPIHDHVFAAVWLADSEFGDSNGHLLPEFLWAAMDCPTGFASGFPTVGKLVTGRMAVNQLENIRIGKEYVLMAWPLGVEGRKHFSAACLYQDEELCAVAKATWIRIEN